MPKFDILIAEDETSIREILVELLNDEGFSCDAAIDGMHATEKLVTKNYDVVISDFRMPRMGGAELLKWCRENNHHMPFIFITANKELVYEEKLALDDCCAAFLQKPIDIDHLIAAINDAKTRNHRTECAVK
jgi:DNA-binding NtrC family response regulator